MLRITDPVRYQAGIDAMTRGCPSPKAMMSFLDAEISERVFLAVVRRGQGLPRILEWGSGLSTLYFARRLAEFGDFLWVTVEYDRGFFDQRVAPYLQLWSDVHVIRVDGPGDLARGLDGGLPARGLVAIVYDAGGLIPHERAQDRLVDLDDYVAAPARLGTSFDAVLVDGRKRRRCLIEASRLVTDDGVVMLHDAQRPYYHCAFGRYRQSRRIGNELWIGAKGSVDLARWLPPEVLAAPGELDDLKLRVRYLLAKYGELTVDGLAENGWISWLYQPDSVERAVAELARDSAVLWDSPTAPVALAEVPAGSS
ncbi:hypothetical protein [Phytohabitans rumicis]|uniref:Uncharacterized protein n=1 Tax=Phytohabitans rumicis TaxID=1076125 RepID=A0A6V8L345_9ACTN|nr:hypothetical protein [Phytohabitans rumicis]GFJ87125.1 hypothetical protein Prum_007670 [Phytohabitans rumicis]